MLSGGTLWSYWKRIISARNPGEYAGHQRPRTRAIWGLRPLLRKDVCDVQIRIKRVYETPSRTDGLRVLVDRLWPRGLKKQDAAIDVWAKELAPSNELRTWFAHEEEKFEEFTRRYRLELGSATDRINELIASAGGRTITLVYGAKNKNCNNAVVLKAWLESRTPDPMRPDAKTAEP